MVAYSYITVTPTEDSWVASYIDNVGAIVHKHGGTYLARTADHAQVEGETTKQQPVVGLRVLIRWPDQAAARAFIADPDYQPLLDARRNGSESLHYLIEGQDDFGKEVTDV